MRWRGTALSRAADGLIQLGDQLFDWAALHPRDLPDRASVRRRPGLHADGLKQDDTLMSDAVDISSQVITLNGVLFSDVLMRGQPSVSSNVGYDGILLRGDILLSTGETLSSGSLINSGALKGDGILIGSGELTSNGVTISDSLIVSDGIILGDGIIYFGFLGCHDEFTAVYRLNLVDNSYRLSRYLDALNMLTDLVVSDVRLEEGTVHNVVTSSPVLQHSEWSRVQ